MIYLDNSATTMVRPEVLEAMLPYLKQAGGNPSSIHKSGQQARQAVDKARAQVAGLLNCDASEVYFTPCATYSNNVALLGRARYAETQGMGKHLITSAIEHPSCLGPAKHLEASGWSVTYLPVDRHGLLDLELLKRHIRPETSIISLMWANNEIGSLFPIAELAGYARQKQIFFHTDAVQVPGKLPIDVQKLGCDTLALSGHKFYAPKGIGVLYKGKRSQLQPIVWGGGQESSLFPGTEAVPNIVGIGVAAELAASELSSVQPALMRMQALLLEKLQALPGLRITGPSDAARRLPGHLSFVIAGMEGEAAVMQCDLKGLCISSASACHKGIKQPSHVVSALGLSDETAMGSIRLSAGRFNTEEECRQAGETLVKVIANLTRQKVQA